jgi:hypothetical protein
MIKNGTIIKCCEETCDQTMRYDRNNFNIFFGMTSSYKCWKCSYSKSYIVFGISTPKYNQNDPIIGDFTNCKLCKSQFVYKDYLLCLVCKKDCRIIN